MNKLNFRAMYFRCAPFILLTALLAFAQSSYAQSGQGKPPVQFGKGQPRTIVDLPPGQLKRRLESLPPHVNAKALKWLQDIDFTNSDLDSLQIDNSGGVYFADSYLPDPALTEAAATATGTATASGDALSDAFLLHSKPGAPNVVFIDFDGHSFSNTAWGSGAFNALPYDLDGNPAAFSDSERRKIVDIWHRVAEDLAPFNIDVTTEEPATFDRYTGRILITRDETASGGAMPHQGAGGVAYVNVFGASNYHTYYSPALVYYDNLGSGFEAYVAEAASHEFGHNLGLSHDGTLSGASYYQGHGTGLVSWAPIMGVGYYKNITQWSKGEYADANQFQDDMAIITSKLGLDADDHQNNYSGGTALLVGGDGSVVSSNPEFDPHNVLTENKGIIHSAADVDVFTFLAGNGPLSLTVTPAWDAFYRATNHRGANLKIRAELRTSGGTLISTSDPADDTKATVSATLTAGAYQLIISGVGNSSVPFSNYASHGQFFINGSMAPAVTDNTAPTPNPMGWASTPAATGENAIVMTATTAVDETSAVQYRFNCTAGGAGCTNSAWQTNKTYTASGLAPDTRYTFTVIARDISGNQTLASTPASATTDTPPPPPPYTNFFAQSEKAVAGTVSGSFSNTFTDNGSSQSITERESSGNPASRYSYLEHRWSFNVSAGGSVTVYANTWSGGSSDGDTFDFQYSLNGGSSWSQMFNVSSTSSGNVHAVAIPGAPSGQIMLRVVDSNRSAGARQLNTVHVDQLYIQVANPPSDPPDRAPTNLSATAVSSSQINLTWTDNSSNEAGFRLDRSLNGSTGWSQIADLPTNSTAFNHTGLQAATSYFYRVSAYNHNGASAYASASATTQSSAPAPAISLSASGRKQQGAHVIDLRWTGTSNVDVYRNGTKIASGVSGNYSDNTGVKGGGSYQHKVCQTGTTTVCSNVTTTTF